MKVMGENAPRRSFEIPEHGVTQLGADYGIVYANQSAISDATK